MSLWDTARDLGEQPIRDTVSKEPEMHQNSLTATPATPTHASLGERVRTAPGGIRAAAGSAAAVVALLGAGLGGFALGQAVDDDTDLAPTSLTNDADPSSSRDAEGVTTGDDAIRTTWYAVPMPAAVGSGVHAA